MENHDKFVRFEQYCSSCKHAKVAEEKEPCCECVAIAVRKNSYIPEYYVKEKQEITNELFTNVCISNVNLFMCIQHYQPYMQMLRTLCYL